MTRTAPPAGSPPVVGLGSVQNGVLNINPSLLSNPTLRTAFANSVLTVGQGDRCPGSMERGPSSGTSAGWYPESGYPCTPSQVPTGP